MGIEYGVLWCAVTVALVCLILFVGILVGPEEEEEDV
jgi:Flp pilus assembly pilin Flp